MILPRFYDSLDKYLEPNKALVIYGPRRVGKTTLLKNYLEHANLKYRLETGEDIRVQEVLDSANLSRIKDFVGDNELLAIDEAQAIPGVGLGLKLIVDSVPGIKIIATGSSSFDLANQVGEPLTGRKRTLILYPVSYLELSGVMTPFEFEQKLPDFLIYGLYPEVAAAANRGQKQEIIEEITNSYLFKDILSLDGVRKSRTVVDLAKLLSLQLGNEVSLNELATQLSVNARTVERYLDLLEKSFVIIPVYSLARNRRNEVRGKRKYYFYDTGIRNALISQFNDLSERNDKGALWENFLMVERLKKRAYQNMYANYYFWRSYSQQEIDLVEEYDGKLHGYEFKWNKTKKAAAPTLFMAGYPNSSYQTISQDNFAEFIGK